jgi:hypothetical protein
MQVVCIGHFDTSATGGKKQSAQGARAADIFCCRKQVFKVGACCTLQHNFFLSLLSLNFDKPLEL